MSSSLLVLLPGLPLAGALVLGLFGGLLPRRVAPWVGVATVGASAGLAVLLARELLASPEREPIVQRLWTLVATDALRVEAALRLDALSLLMTLVVTVVGFLIHVYSTGYMRDDEGVARFFAYMNLFVASMLILVLADDLLVLFFGWEGVGLCSYLLIGFWFDDPKNCLAARKAFVVTRVGDALMMVGLLVLVRELGTLHIATVLERAPREWMAGGALATGVALALLGGAIGKSGQVPLQVWLPDAMAGPTPVSALIHAATMVTAGVYLIARMHPMFVLAPRVMALVAVLGAATLLLGGLCALVQHDIKRVLAYSTISQIGYMFLALGVGAWSAAMFHFLTHAVFKALLFMGAGAVIVALHHEQDLYRMGGLRRALPLVFWTFVIGAVSLAALPLVGAGFYSKDEILAEVWASPDSGRWLWLAGIAGALLTAIYTTRLVALAFLGEPRGERRHLHAPGAAMTWPLVALAIGSTVVGFLEVPRSIAEVDVLSRFLEPVLPRPEHHLAVSTELALQVAAAVVVFVGLAIGWWLWGRRAAKGRTSAPEAPLLEGGLGFDRLYAALIVAPYAALAALQNKRDVADFARAATERLTWRGGGALARAQNGRLRGYLAGAAAGLGLAIAWVVLG